MLTTDDVQAAAGTAGGAEQNIGAAPGNIGGHGDRGFGARRRNHRGLVLILRGIEHRVCETRAFKLARQDFGVGNAVGADQHRSPCGVQFTHARDHCSPACCGMGKHARRQQRTATGQAQRYLHHADVVDAAQFAARFEQRAAHAAQPQITREKALIGDLRHGFNTRAGLAALLDLHQLMQAARPRATGGLAPGGVVNDVHLVLLHHVVTTQLQHVACGQCQRHQVCGVSLVEPRA